tara:strand:- start:561 stop:1022 length:462 start_codon:yes stop_codon:yes gene_type:complete
MVILLLLFALIFVCAATEFGSMSKNDKPEMKRKSKRKVLVEELKERVIKSLREESEKWTDASVNCNRHNRKELQSIASPSGALRIDFEEQESSELDFFHPTVYRAGVSIVLSDGSYYSETYNGEIRRLAENVERRILKGEQTNIDSRIQNVVP